MHLFWSATPFYWVHSTKVIFKSQLHIFYAFHRDRCRGFLSVPTGSQNAILLILIIHSKTYVCKNNNIYIKNLPFTKAKEGTRLLAHALSLSTLSNIFLSFNCDMLLLFYCWLCFLLCNSYRQHTMLKVSLDIIFGCILANIIASLAGACITLSS